MVKILLMDSPYDLVIERIEIRDIVEAKSAYHPLCISLQNTNFYGHLTGASLPESLCQLLIKVIYRLLLLLVTVS